MARHGEERGSGRGRRDRPESVRGVRLEELIREELNLLLDSEVADPTLEYVRVTTVSLSPDGSRARVFFLVDRNDTETSVKDIERSLVRATGFLRRELCDALSLKRTPELRFVLDLEALGGADRMPSESD